MKLTTKNIGQCAKGIMFCICMMLLASSCSTKEKIIDRGLNNNPYQRVLQSLDWGTDTCFVYGHKIPDVDAVTSALSYAKLMRAMGYNCKAKVSSKINRETEYIARHFNFAIPELKDTVVPKTRLILTDHTDYSQCVDGARQAVILQKIDHHVEGDIADATIPYVRREMLGSTNTIIYSCYNELGVKIDDATARVMLAGLVSDTRNLTKSITTGADTIAWQALTNQLGISADSMAIINYYMEQAAYDYSGMTDVDIFLSDYKDYEMSNHKIGIGSMACKDEEMDAFITRMLEAMPTVAGIKGREMLFAKIDCLVKNPDASRKDKPYIENGLYFIYYGPGAKNVAEGVYGTSQREGVCFTTENLSRKQIVPKMMGVLSN